MPFASLSDFEAHMFLKVCTNDIEGPLHELERSTDRVRNAVLVYSCCRPGQIYSTVSLMTTLLRCSISRDHGNFSGSHLG